MKKINYAALALVIVGLVVCATMIALNKPTEGTFMLFVLQVMQSQLPKIYDPGGDALPPSPAPAPPSPPPPPPPPDAA